MRISKAVMAELQKSKAFKLGIVKQGQRAWHGLGKGEGRAGRGGEGQGFLLGLGTGHDDCGGGDG